MGRRVDLAWDDGGVLNPPVYPDTVFLFERMGEATFKMLSPAPGEIVLDLGCGRATDAIKLAEMGGKAIGLDPSKVMMKKARSLIEKSNTKVALVQGIGEGLPFKAHSLDKVMCKGSLDHFIDPAKTMAEIARVLKPGGKAVFTIANFDSLSCKLGEALYPITRLLPGERRGKPWEMPHDHTYRFNYPMLRHFVDGYLEFEKAIGVSFLWGVPLWGRLLEILPRGLSTVILNLLDKLARRFPTRSDVIVLRCTPRPIL